MEPNTTAPQQDVAQRPVNNPTPPPITPQKKSHNLLWLVIIALILVVVGSGILWIFSSNYGLRLLNTYNPKPERTLQLATNSVHHLSDYSFNGSVTIATSTPHIVNGFMSLDGKVKLNMSYKNISAIDSDMWDATVISSQGKVYGQDSYDGSWHDVNDGVESRLPIPEMLYASPLNLLNTLCASKDWKFTSDTNSSGLGVMCSAPTLTGSPFQGINYLGLVIDKGTYDVTSFTLVGTTTKNYSIHMKIDFANQDNQHQVISTPEKINPYGDFLARESVLINSNQGKSFDYLWPAWEQANFNCTRCVNQLGDVDGDGLVNGLEFLFGIDPHKNISGSLLTNDLSSLVNQINPVTGLSLPAAYASSTPKFLQAFTYKLLKSTPTNIGIFSIRASSARIPVVFKSNANQLTLKYATNLPAGDYITVFIGDKEVKVIVLDGIHTADWLNIPVSEFAGTTTDLTVILNPYDPSNYTFKGVGNFSVTFPNMQINPYDKVHPFYFDATSAPLKSLDSKSLISSTPNGGEQWKIGTNRVIEWQGPADTEYSLIVVDPKTNQTLGIIGNTKGAEAGDKQHGYAWVVGQYVTPVGSIQKILPPGNYEILATYASDSQYMIIPVALFTAI